MKKNRDFAPRRRAVRGISLLSMMLVLVVLGLIFFFAFRRSPAPEATTIEGVEIPTDPAQAPDVVRKVLCEQTCDTDARECRTLAPDNTARQRCIDELPRCVQGCR